MSRDKKIKHQRKIDKSKTIITQGSDNGQDNGELNMPNAPTPNGQMPNGEETAVVEGLDNGQDDSELNAPNAPTPNGQDEKDDRDKKDEQDAINRINSGIATIREKMEPKKDKNVEEAKEPQPSFISEHGVAKSPNGDQPNREQSNPEPVNLFGATSSASSNWEPTAPAPAQTPAPAPAQTPAPAPAPAPAPGSKVPAPAQEFKAPAPESKVALSKPSAQAPHPSQFGSTATRVTINVGDIEDNAAPGNFWESNSTETPPKPPRADVNNPHSNPKPISSFNSGVVMGQDTHLSSTNNTNSSNQSCSKKWMGWKTIAAIMFAISFLVWVAIYLFYSFQKNGLATRNNSNNKKPNSSRKPNSSNNRRLNSNQSTGAKKSKK